MPRLRPRLAVYLNLFRDQLDRYGEVDSVAEGWARALGEVAEPERELFTVTDLSSVWVLADVYEKDITKVRAATYADRSAASAER